MKKASVYVIPLAIMIYIFIHSAFPADLSSRESAFFVRVVLLFWDADPGLVTHLVRKCAHFTEFALLGASLLPAACDLYDRRQSGDAGRSSAGVRRAAGVGAWLFGTLYAVTDEVHQIFVAGRSCELTDVLIDSAGVLAGVLAISGIRRILRRPEPENG